MPTHTFEPYYNSDSKILILGSFPSRTSRAQNFYYMHKQNRFWQVLSLVFNELISSDIPSKKAFLKKHKIALYDVIYACDITSSSDASIKNVIPTNIQEILKNSNIKTIFTVGTTATKLYQKYHYPVLKIEAIALPSTSSANAKLKLNDLVNVYQVLTDYV